MKVKILLSYYLENKIYMKEFLSFYELEKFIEKLFEIKQTNKIYLDSSSIELLEEILDNSQDYIKGIKSENPPRLDGGNHNQGEKK